jgi:hypothetical protein
MLANYMKEWNAWSQRYLGALELLYYFKFFPSCRHQAHLSQISGRQKKNVVANGPIP